MDLGPEAGRVAVVSGAGGGIGRALVRELATHGYRLSLGDLNTDQLVELHGAATDRQIYAVFDAFRPETAQEWISKTLDHFGRIDALVNCLGSGERVTLYDDNDAGLDRLWAVNVKAPARLTRLCLPHLEQARSGRVVNIVSLGGKRVRNTALGYAMTKFALMGLTHATRTATWDVGIRATAICPGWVRTETALTSPTLKIKPEQMIAPETIAHLVRTTIELPNNAAIAEVLVNCEFEDVF